MIRHAVLVWLFAVAILTGATRIAVAQENEWQPPAPEPELMDWVQLVSGEWLRGEVQYLRDDEFVFDSDELDVLTLEWEKISQLRSPRILSYYFEDIGVVTGTAVMKDSAVYVRADAELHAFPRSRLLSIIEGELTELNFWSGKIQAGLVARSGNTDQADLNTLLYLRRQNPWTRLDLNFAGNYGRVGGEQNIDNQSGSLNFNIMITSGFFVTPASIDMFADKFQNVKLRSTYGAGVGYFITRTSKTEWLVKLNGGYQLTRYISVEAGENDKQETGNVTPETSLEMDVTGTLELIAQYSAMVGLPDPKQSFQNASILFTLDAFDDLLELSVSFTWDHNESPRPGSDGIVPKRDDFRTAVGIGIDF